METYQTRDAARQEVFDDIGMFDPPKRKHTNNGMLSPVDYEIKQQRMDEAGVWDTRGTTYHPYLMNLLHNAVSPAKHGLCDVLIPAMRAPKFA